MSKLKVLDLFSGIGGFSLGLEKSGNFSTIAFCEIDKHCQKVLNKNFPDVPVFEDITKLYSTHIYDGENYLTSGCNPPDGRPDLEVHYDKIDLICGRFPCFVKDTLIMTRSGYKPIQDIKLGEEVLTHKRRWRKVIQKHETPNRYIRILRSSGSFDIFTTDEHPFYSTTTIKEWDRLKKSNKLRVGVPQWVLAKNLENRFIGHTFIPNKNDTYNYKLSKDYWWLIGRCLADGWVVNRLDRGNGEVGRVVLCCGHHENIDEQVGKVFHFNKIKERTTYKYHITNVEFAREFEKAGRLAHNKFIPNEWLRLPKKYLKSLIEGYFSGDGYKDSNGEIKVSSVSKKLILTLKMAILKVYKKQPRLYFTKRASTRIIEGRTVNQRDIYSLVLNLQPDSFKKTFYKNNFGWSKCLLSKDTRVLDTVYNIGVEEDESYIADGAVVHNCQDISIGGAKKGIINGKRSALWKEYSRLIREIRPRWIIIENVEQLRKNGLGIILNDLSKIGYDAEWHCITANSIGLPHQRDRLFLIAYSSSFGLDEYFRKARYLHFNEEWENTKAYLKGEKCFLESIPVCQILPHWAIKDKKNSNTSKRTIVSKFRRVTNGIPFKLDEFNRKQRIKQLGNAIVPDIVEIIGDCIFRIERILTELREGGI